MLKWSFGSASEDKVNISYKEGKELFGVPAQLASDIVCFEFRFKWF